MSRNYDQVRAIIRKMSDRDIEYTSGYPLHMAISYLDGSNHCCNILSLLVGSLTVPQLRKAFVNELGHTVWDSLMISILKSHSSTRPVILNETWKETSRFPGEEVDICGRWDADSPVLRHLFASGGSSTPSSWKHKFCHTSAQTICHCIMRMYNVGHQPVLWDAPSGLYLRRCSQCDTELRLETFHSLVMTAYHLANNSRQGEDLFGMLACLLCFIACHEAPQKAASVSVAALMDGDPLEGECDHEKLTAAGLAEKISLHPTSRTWDETVQSGWKVFCGVLRLCENAENYAHAKAEEKSELVSIDLRSHAVCRSYYMQKIMGCFCSKYGFPGHNYEAVPVAFRARPDLASLWAAAQAEILIHRRTCCHLGWTSLNFSMRKLQDQLSRNVSLSTGYIDRALLKPHCPCGMFNCKDPPNLADVLDSNIGTGPNPLTKLVDSARRRSYTTYCYPRRIF
jgi:hypothetical protein